MDFLLCDIDLLSSFATKAVVYIAHYSNPFLVTEILEKFFKRGFQIDIFNKQLVIADADGRIALDYLLANNLCILKDFPKEHIRLLNLITTMLDDFGPDIRERQIHLLTEPSYKIYRNLVKERSISGSQLEVCSIYFSNCL